MQELGEGSVPLARAHAFSVRVQHEPCRERSDDAGEADQLGRVGECEAQEEADREHDLRMARAGGEPDDRLREEVAEPSDEAEEDDGAADDARDGEEGERFASRGGRGEAGDEGQHDQAEHVVEDGCAEDDPALRALGLAEILEHAGGDADAGGGQRGADEDMRRLRAAGQEPGRDSPAERQGRGDTDERHEQGRGADPDEQADVGLEPHVEQQDEDSDLGQDLKGRLGLHVRDRFGAAEQDDQAGEGDADHELAEHRWLAEPLGREPAEVGSEQGNAGREEDPADRPLARAACSEGHPGPRGQDGGEQENDPGPHGGPSLRRLSGRDRANVVDGRHGRLARQQREDHGQDDKRRQQVAAGADGEQ